MVEVVETAENMILNWTADTSLRFITMRGLMSLNTLA